MLNIENGTDITDNVEARLDRALTANAKALPHVGVDVWRMRRRWIAEKQAEFRAIDDRLAFIDQELSWVSSDQVADSLESSRRALVDARFRLNNPVSR
jgi:hypothetical protein